MADLEILLKGTAAFISAGFALALLVGGSRRPANWFLALFLGLLAGNQAAETLRGLATDPEVSLFWFRVATAFAGLDPFALYYFASLFPERNTLNRRVYVWLAMAPAAVFTLSAAWIPSPESASPAFLTHAFFLTVYTATMYSIVLLHSVNLYRNQSTDPVLGRVCLGLAAATLPLWTRLPLKIEAWRVQGETASQSVPAQAVAVVFMLALGALVLWYQGRSSVGRWNVAWPTIVLGVTLAIALRIELFLSTAQGRWPPEPNLRWIPRSGTAIRFLLFAGFLAAAALRYEHFIAAPRLRRRAARVFVATLAVAAVVILVIVADPWLKAQGWQPDAAYFVLVAVVLLLSQGFANFVGFSADRLFGPRAGVTARDDWSTQLVRTNERIADRYRIERLLGEGGTGRVYLAEDDILQRRVVVKQWSGSEEADRDAALREARVAGSLQHANVVTVYDALSQGSRVLMVSEYVPGGSLAQRIAEQGPLAPREGWRIIDGILAGLEAVHARGIIHRDLKPGNVLLDPDGRPKIADFGVARHAESKTQSDQTGAVTVGTPAFMAPEQRRGRTAVEATDLYAVGLIARRCVAGPWDPAVEKVIQRATAPAIKDRYPSAKTMRKALRAALAA